MTKTKVRRKTKESPAPQSELVNDYQTLTMDGIMDQMLGSMYSELVRYGLLVGPDGEPIDFHAAIVDVDAGAQCFRNVDIDAGAQCFRNVDIDDDDSVTRWDRLVLLCSDGSVARMDPAVLHFLPIVDRDKILSLLDGIRIAVMHTVTTVKHLALKDETYTHEVQPAAWLMPEVHDSFPSTVTAGVINNYIEEVMRGLPESLK